MFNLRTRAIASVNRLLPSRRLAGGAAFGLGSVFTMAGYHFENSPGSSRSQRTGGLPFAPCAKGGLLVFRERNIPLAPLPALAVLVPKLKAKRLEEVTSPNANEQGGTEKDHGVQAS